jgi:two-component system chemotaxis response regulator CheY
MKALVVDDSKAIRSIITKHLKALSFEVVEAVSGVEALVKLKKMGGADIALLDWNMPEMDGFEFLRRVRGDAEFSDLVVMMVTTESEMSQVAKALEAGANEYLMKPFTKEALQEKLVLLGLDPGEAAA